MFKIHFLFGNLLKYAFRGGIDAVNEFQVFKVTPIQTVPIINNMRQDNRHGNQKGTESTEPVTFAGELKKVMDQGTPSDCYTVTYNRGMKLQSFFYTEQREYSRVL